MPANAARLRCPLVTLALALASPSGADAQQRVLMRGTVADAESQAPISGAYVEIPNTRFSARSGDDGRWSLGRLPVGHYSLRVARLGYAPVTIDTVHVAAGDSVVVRAELMRMPLPLAAVIVTPGFYGMMQTGLTSAHTLSRQQIEAAPQLGEDIYRAAARLPGVSANDMSARFTVRGAGGDELYATLDGLELDEPFHLKDIDAALSILDVSAIAGVELSTGGFTAQHGNRLTGVFAMHSVEPRTDRVRTSLALSILNARYAAQGGVGDGRVGWYVSARRGYLDLALKLVSEDDSISPRYYDLFGKVHYDMPRGGRVTLHTLLAGDRLRYLDGPDQLISRYGTSYLWATWKGNFAPRLTQTTVLSTGRIIWDRGGEIFDRDGTQTMFLDDRRAYDVSVLRQDLALELSAAALLKFGWEGKLMPTSYDYQNWITRESVENGAVVTRTDSVEADLSPNGTLASAYVSHRLLLLPSVTTELGVRFDAASWTDDADVSLRLNVAWEPSATTSVRAALGRYTQPQQLHALQVSDGVTEFLPSEHAIHFGLGLERRLPRTFTARLEAYDRRLTRLRPRFVNRTNELAVFPEVEEDRLRIDPSRGRTRGVEAFLRSAGAGHGRVEWSATYALASATERVGLRDVPRPMDQRHTVNGDWSLRSLSNKWRLSAAWLWHTGWPATPRTFKIDTIAGTTPASTRLSSSFGEYASERLPAYRRFDIRFTRYFDTRRGRVALYADVFNVFSIKNARGYEYFVLSTSPSLIVDRRYDTMLPRLPSLGLSWEF